MKLGSTEYNDKKKPLSEPTNNPVQPTRQLTSTSEAEILFYVSDSVSLHVYRPHRLSIVRMSLMMSLYPGQPVCRFDIAMGMNLNYHWFWSEYSVTPHFRHYDRRPIQTIIRINENDDFVHVI